MAYISFFLIDDAGIPIASLYFATVLLATFIPYSFSKSEILLSDRGFLGSSPETNSFILAFIAVEDASDPSSDPTDEE